MRQDSGTGSAQERSTPASSFINGATYYADDPFKAMVRKYDAAVMEKGGASIFALRTASLPRPAPYMAAGTVKDRRSSAEKFAEAKNAAYTQFVEAW